MTLTSESMGVDSPEADAREQLGADYDSYFEAGRALSLEEAATELFQEPDERGDPLAS